MTTNNQWADLLNNECKYKNKPSGIKYEWDETDLDDLENVRDFCYQDETTFVFQLL